MTDYNLQTDLDDARTGWEAAVEEVRNLDEALRKAADANFRIVNANLRKDALLREALEAIQAPAPHSSECTCTACRIRRELGEVT